MIDLNGFDVGFTWLADETHFYVNGFVNKQSCGIGGTQNHFLSDVKLLHSSKVTAWTTTSSKRIIGPFFKHGTINTEG